MSVERRVRHGRTHYVARVGYRGQRLSYWRETLEDARAAEAVARAAIGRGEAPPDPERRARSVAAPARPVTVADAADEFIEGASTGRIRSRSGRPYRPSTVSRYEERLRLHVLPHIGALRLDELRRGDVRRLVEDLAHAESPAIARDVRATLRLVLQRQVDLEVVPTNPADRIASPSPERRPPRFLTPAEAERVEAAAAARSAETSALVRLALGTGARAGELLALRWSDLDLSAGSARIEGTWNRNRREIGPPKGGRSRTVPLGAELAAELRRWRLASPASLDGDFVIPLRDTQQAWTNVRRRAGLNDPPPRFHDLRHTAATFWLAAGLREHVVAELLGHTTTKLVRELYGHALPSETASAGQVLKAWRRGHFTS